MKEKYYTSKKKKKIQGGEPDQTVQHTKQLPEGFGGWTFHILEESQNVEQVMAQSKFPVFCDFV